MWTNVRLSVLVAMSVWMAGCFEAKDNPPLPGGESNFLLSCDGACADGLRCICGVCTRACSSDRTCESLSGDAVCVGKDDIGDPRSCELAERKEAPATCDVRCIADRDCEDGRSCQAGVCREKPAEGQLPEGMAAEDSKLSPDAPLVMLLLDTSGSMTDKSGCVCASATDCTNCSPRCDSGDQNKWFITRAALTGSFVDFACEARERTAENGATYDEGYILPDYVLSEATRQRGDGLIAAYATRVQLGLATFDSEYTYRGSSDTLATSEFDSELSASAAGMYSYGGLPPDDGQAVRGDGSVVGRVFYPGVMAPGYYVNTGIRSTAARNANDGALSLPRMDAPLGDRTRTVSEQLHGIRPYGGSPTAAAFDDLYYFFSADAAGMQVGAPRPRHVVFITDGAPDTDFRDFDCNCRTVDDCNGLDPSLMSCPYPTAAAAARRLRCGDDAECDRLLVNRIHVIGLGVSNGAVRDELDAIASAGGTSAQYATTQAELRAALREVFDVQIPAAGR